MQYHGWWNSATARVALCIVCNRLGSTERAASSAYHGIGAWGERRQLTSWPSRSTALLFYCLPPHLPPPTSPPLRLQIPGTIRHYQLPKYSGTRWNRDLLVGRNLWLCSLLHKSCKNSVADGFCSRVSDLKCLSTKVYNRAVGIWELVYRLFHRDHSIILNGSV